VSKIKPVAKHGYAKERGVLVPTTKVPISESSGYSRFEMDLSQALCPDKSYAADMAGAVYEMGEVLVLFGQRSRDGNARSLVEISMSPLSVLQTLQSASNLSGATLQEIMGNIGDNERELSSFSEDPKEVARLKANLVYMAFNGSEACLDFFDTSPFTIRKLLTGESDKGNVAGIVRIDTQTALIKSLLTKLTELSSQFPSALRRRAGADHE
jgi:hypothetical protein